MTELAGLVAALSLLGGGERRGVFFEQTTVSFIDGVQAGPGVVSRTWASGRRLRMEASGGADAPAFILRLDEGRALRLFPSEKTAAEIDIGRLRAQSQMDLSTAGALLGGAEEGEARSAELKTPRTIAGHACRGYRLTAGSTVLDIYARDPLAGQRSGPAARDGLHDHTHRGRTAAAGALRAAARIPDRGLGPGRALREDSANRERARIVELGREPRTASGGASCPGV
jgi:hypothetical protein